MSPVEIWSQPRLGLSQVYLKATLGLIFNFLFFWSKPIDKQLKTCLTSRRRNKEEEGKGWKQKQDLKAIVELKQNEEKTRLGLLQKNIIVPPLFVCWSREREKERERESEKVRKRRKSRKGSSKNLVRSFRSRFFSIQSWLTWCCCCCCCVLPTCWFQSLLLFRLLWCLLWRRSAIRYPPPAERPAPNMTTESIGTNWKILPEQPLGCYSAWDGFDRHGSIGRLQVYKFSAAASTREAANRLIFDSGMIHWRRLSPPSPFPLFFFDVANWMMRAEPTPAKEKVKRGGGDNSYLGHVVEVVEEAAEMKLK